MFILSFSVLFDTSAKHMISVAIIPSVIQGWLLLNAEKRKSWSNVWGWVSHLLYLIFIPMGIFEFILNLHLLSTSALCKLKSCMTELLCHLKKILNQYHASITWKGISYSCKQDCWENQNERCYSIEDIFGKLSGL